MGPAGSELLYFAYGSNMCTRRIRARVASASPRGTAKLAGWVVGFCKRGVDGSGKCTLFRTGREQDEVHGVLFVMNSREKALLDEAEGLGTGYAEKLVTVIAQSGPVEAFTYVAMESYLDRGLRPYDWYREFVLVGAEEHGLPDWYVKALAQTPADPDPDRARTELNRSILSG